MEKHRQVLQLCKRTSSVHTCTGTHKSTDTQTHAFTCTHARTHTNTYVHMQTHTHTRTHARTHAHMRAHTHTHTHTYTHTHAHTRAHTHTHNTHTHTHTHMPWVWGCCPLLVVPPLRGGVVLCQSCLDSMAVRIHFHLDSLELAGPWQSRIFSPLELYFEETNHTECCIYLNGRNVIKIWKQRKTIKSEMVVPLAGERYSLSPRNL